MKKKLPLLFLVTVLLSFLSNSQTTNPKREFRGAWIATVINLDWPSTNTLSSQEQQNELTTLLDQLQALGINAVLFQVRSESDAMYNSPYEPWSYWLTGQQGKAPSPYYDPLAFAVEEAHKRGMELHAWFNPYRVERQAGNYTTASNHVTNTHSDWIFQTGTAKMLDPGKRDARDHIVKVVMDVVRRYDIDGVHFDDYFYPYPPTHMTANATYNALDDATFANEPRGFSDKSDWRRDNVNIFIKQLYDSIQIVKPFVKLGISPFGIWKHGIPSGITGMNAYTDIYCDAIAWLQQKSIDYLTPQLYWKITGSQDYATLMPWWADSVRSNARHFYPGHAPYRINTSNWSSSELPNQIRLDRQPNRAQGSVFFRARNGLTDNLKGFADSLKNDLYKYPALLPVMSWKDTIAPNVPTNVRYERIAGTGPSVLRWDVPSQASDGNTASRYVVYRYTNSTIDKEDPSTILSLVGEAKAFPKTPAVLNQQYYFGVTALDRNYNESNLSNIIAVASPSIPLLALPANGQMNIAPMQKIIWNAPSTAATYQVHVATDSTFASNFLVNEETLDTLKLLSNMKGEQQYFWRVRANNAGGTSLFSAVRSFTTGFPATPVIAYPTNLMMNVPLQISLKWNKNSIATSYRVQLASALDFTNILIDSSSTDTLVAVPTLQPNTIYFWRMTASNAIGTGGWSEIWKFKTTTSLYASLASDVPKEYQLQQNYPNPFNPTTTISYQIPATNVVSLKLYDVLGREIATLVDETLNAGYYSYQLSTSSYQLSSGVYFYRLQAGNFVVTKKMIIQK